MYLNHSLDLNLLEDVLDIVPVEWLGQKVIHARRSRLLLVRLLHVRRATANEGLGDVRLVKHLPDLLGDLWPVHPLHRVVQEDQLVHLRALAHPHVVHSLLDLLDAFLAVDGLLARDIDLAEQRTDHEAIDGLVVDDEHETVTVAVRVAVEVHVKVVLLLLLLLLLMTLGAASLPLA